MTVTPSVRNRPLPGTQFSWTRPEQADFPATNQRFSGAKPDLAAEDRTHIFSAVAAVDYARIAALGSARKFDRGEMLCIEGDIAQRAHLLVTGLAKTTQVSASGAEVILKVSRPGDMIGGVSLFSTGRHSHSVQALRPCRVLSWDAATLKSLMARYPVLQENMVRILGENLREMEQRFREVATESVGPRLARQMVRLIRQIGEKSAGGVDMSLSREELAQMTGTTIFTVSRTLCFWQELGWVRCGRNSVTICDVQSLLALSS